MSERIVTIGERTVTIGERTLTMSERTVTIGERIVRMGATESARMISLILTIGARGRRFGPRC